MLRVLVLAESAISRAGLEALVRAEPRFALVASAARSVEIPSLVRDHAPDVMLAETSLDPSSLAKLQKLSMGPGSPAFVVLAGPLGRLELRRTLRSGIRAVLPHDSNSAEIVAAIEAAGVGLTVISADDLELLVPFRSESLRDEDGDIGIRPGEPLTPRETEVLGMMAEGAANKEIAARLHISEHTAKFHVSAVLGKLGASSRTEAVARGLREGLVTI